MKTLLVAALMIGSFNVFADHHENDGKTFEEKKSMMLSHIDKKIAHMNEKKSCVQAAKDKEGLKACREKMKEHHKEMKKEWKDKKKK